MARDRVASFQFYPRDFISDPAVMAMTLAERGAYITLICAAWMSDEPGVLSADDAILARLTQASPAEWRKVRDGVARAFDTDSRPGSWVQRRMVRVRAEQADRFARASVAGRIGATTRWGGS